MAARLAIALLVNALAFAPTLSMLLLVFWQDRRTERGRALFQFLGSLALFQGATFLTHFSLLADFPDFPVENCLNLTLAAFALVTLTAPALLIHTSAAMKYAWVIQRASQPAWPKTVHEMAPIVTPDRQLPQTVLHLGERARHFKGRICERRIPMRSRTFVRRKLNVS